jgi:hypothetical protein
MPTRRTSPRRIATRPTVPLDRYEADAEIAGAGRLAAAAPWLALGAAAIAIAALAVSLLGRGGSLDACRRAAWASVPAVADLPTGWALNTTDLNANGMTVSIVSQTPTDGTTSPPVVYASVTCYGDVAATALSQYRDAATAAGATVTNRGLDGDAYDVDNRATGSVTTLFRVGGLIGQVADSGTAAPSELAKITLAVATAMGDRTAAGTAESAANPSGAAGSPASLEPGGSDGAGGSEPPGAPELEAHLPTEIAGTTLQVQSGSAADGLPSDPNSRAFAAAVRGLGVDLADVQIGQASDPSGAIDLDIFGFRAAGVDSAKLRTAVIETWLSAGAAGVKQTDVKLAGKTFTKIDYGDNGRLDYVYRGSDFVLVVETSDPDIATEVAAKLK